MTLTLFASLKLTPDRAFVKHVADKVRHRTGTQYFQWWTSLTEDRGRCTETGMQPVH
jgi:hypothetical protein